MYFLTVSAPCVHPLNVLHPAVLLGAVSGWCCHLAVCGGGGHRHPVVTQHMVRRAGVGHLGSQGRRVLLPGGSEGRKDYLELGRMNKVWLSIRLDLETSAPNSGMVDGGQGDLGVAAWGHLVEGDVRSFAIILLDKPTVRVTAHSGSTTSRYVKK